MVRKQTLARIVVERAGFKRAPRVLGLLVAWAAFVKLNGRSPSRYELAGENGSRSQAMWYRDYDEFCLLFPEEESPDRLARLLLRRGASLSVMGAFDVPWVGLEAS